MNPSPLPQEQELNEMVRDFTEVVPRPKSEVRRRIRSLLEKAKQEGRDQAISRVEHSDIFRMMAGNTTVCTSESELHEVLETARKDSV